MPTYTLEEAVKQAQQSASAQRAETIQRIQTESSSSREERKKKGLRHGGESVRADEHTTPEWAKEQLDTEEKAGQQASRTRMLSPEPRQRRRKRNDYGLSRQQGATGRDRAA